ncbi:MAG: hypothetical protein EAZ26_06650 [Runella slithyformis]|nr:MAG: hypothetical protein EAZ26_06650 [Runella slithyformis]
MPTCMIENFLSNYSNKFVSRYFVLAIDLLVVFASFVVACLLRFNLHIAEVNQIMNRTSGIEKLHDLFEITFLSYEMGLMKPDPAIYLRVLEEGGMLASETLFLDDNADNIKSAQSLGIQTIQVQKPTTILEYLADF